MIAETYTSSPSDTLTSSIAALSAVGPTVHKTSSFSGSQQAAVTSGRSQRPNRRLRRLRISGKRLRFRRLVSSDVQDAPVVRCAQKRSEIVVDWCVSDLDVPVAVAFKSDKIWSRIFKFCVLSTLCRRGTLLLKTPLFLVEMADKVHDVAGQPSTPTPPLTPTDLSRQVKRSVVFCARSYHTMYSEHAAIFMAHFTCQVCFARKGLLLNKLYTCKFLEHTMSGKET